MPRPREKAFPGAPTARWVGARVFNPPTWGYPPIRLFSLAHALSARGLFLLLPLAAAALRLEKPFGNAERYLFHCSLVGLEASPHLEHVF